MSGRGVAITGAASGIGLAAARRLAGEGWTVFGIDRDRAALDAVAADGRFHALACDVSERAQVDAAFAAIGAATPVLEALVCCAGPMRASVRARGGNCC